MGEYGARHLGRGKPAAMVEVDRVSSEVGYGPFPYHRASGITRASRGIKYLEDEHGIELSDLTLSVEKRSIYSNEKLKRVDPDYFHLFQKIGNEDKDE